MHLVSLSRRAGKLNHHLEAAIHEAMSELDKMSGTVSFTHTNILSDSFWLDEGIIQWSCCLSICRFTRIVKSNWPNPRGGRSPDNSSISVSLSVSLIVVLHSSRRLIMAPPSSSDWQVLDQPIRKGSKKQVAEVAELFFLVYKKKYQKNKTRKLLHLKTQTVQIFLICFQCVYRQYRNFMVKTWEEV